MHTTGSVSLKLVLYKGNSSIIIMCLEGLDGEWDINTKAKVYIQLAGWLDVC